MKRLSFKIRTLFSMLGLALMSSVSICAQTNERVYAIGELNLDLSSGGETQYFAVHLENASQDYVAYQVDIVLPPGLELATYEGEPDIYIDDVSLYPTTRKGATYHTLAVDVNSNRVRVICADIDGNRAFKARSGELFLVGVVSSPYLKPGDVSVDLKNVVLSDINAEGPVYETMDQHMVGMAGSTSTLNLKVSSNNRFGTVILPFDVNEMPVGLEAYSCDELDGDYLILQKQSTMQAFTPYILYAPNGFDGQLSGDVDAQKYQLQNTSGYLNGTIIKTEVQGGNGHYVLQNQGEGPMFYKVNDTPFAIPAGKCWLTLPEEAHAVASFRLPNPTAIESIPSESANSQNVIYDLSGRKVQKAQKGVYIQKGRKLVK